jgi:acetyl-CoA carboxylase carboxyl transferase subunit beta
MKSLTSTEINQQFLVLEDGRYSLPRESQKKLATLVDDGSFEEYDRELRTVDLLEFVDKKTYVQRIEEATKKTGLTEAFIGGYATIGGYPVMIGSLDFRFIGGSLGSVMGEKVVRLCDRAIEKETPLILISASGGARMQEGLMSLMQMAKSSVGINRLKEHGLPYISILTHPTTGGVTASFAMQGDIIMSEPNTMIGFAGPRVIEQTVDEKLPPGFQLSDNLLEEGMLDMVVPGNEIRESLFGLIRILMFSRGHSLPECLVAPEPLQDDKDRSIPDEIDFRVCRRRDRPRTSDYIRELITGFVELHGDRRFADDPSIIAGLGFFQGIPVAVVGHEKGKTPDDMIRRNFGMTHPEGFRKSQRIMDLAERFELPLITFIDTSGAYPGVAAERRGQAEAIASNLAKVSGLRGPVVAINIGEGGSGGALALAMGNRVAMLRSSISPEGCASILFRDSGYADRAAKSMRISASDCYELEIIDRIIEDGIDGKDVDFSYAAKNIEKFIYDCLLELLPMSGDELVAHRYDKFRNMGIFREGASE